MVNEEKLDEVGTKIAGLIRVTILQQVGEQTAKITAQRNKVREDLEGANAQIAGLKNSLLKEQDTTKTLSAQNDALRVELKAAKVTIDALQKALVKQEEGGQKT